MGQEQAENMKRDRALDAMRGIAIFLMVQSNTAASVFFHSYPAWMQWYTAVGSFVPALFTLLAGVVVVYTTAYKGYTLKHFLLRASALLLAAALILDIFIWEIVPFVGVDVLYLIAVALPIAYLFQYLSAWARWGAVLTVFGMTPVLQGALGYSPHPLILPLFHDPVYADLAGQTSILNHWLVDGWFPIFPWLGFVLLGVNLGLLRLKARRTGGAPLFNTKNVVFAGAALIFVGVLLWQNYAGPMYIRDGFSESIYPPTLAYIITAIGQIILLFALIDHFPTLRIYTPLIVLGESSLFTYLFHYGAISLLPTHTHTAVLVGVVTLILAGLFAIAYALRRARKRWPGRGAFMRYVLGV